MADLTLAELVQLKRAKEQADSVTTKAAIRFDRSEEAYRAYGARNLGKGHGRWRQLSLRIVSG